MVYCCMNHNKGYKISCRLDGLLERTAAEIVNSKRMNERRSHNIHSYQSVAGPCLWLVENKDFVLQAALVSPSRSSGKQ